MKVIFFGTPSFAVHILERLVKEGIHIVAVVTQPDRPKGRFLHLQPPPVKEWLLAHQPTIPCYQPEKVSTPEMAQILSAYQADIFLVVGYGEILKDFILSLPKIDCINIHTSLLPKYRGAAPIQRAILAGENTLGITIMRMVKQMDAGGIFAQNSSFFSEKQTFGEIERSLAFLAADLIVEVLPKIFHKTIPCVAQDESKVTFAPKILPEDLQIQWERPAKEILNQIRAFSPIPGAICRVKIKDVEKSFKIISASYISQQSKPRDLQSCGKAKWCIGCGEGALELHEVKPEGKPQMSFDAFLRGNQQVQFL